MGWEDKAPSPPQHGPAQSNGLQHLPTHRAVAAIQNQESLFPSILQQCIMKRHSSVSLILAKGTTSCQLALDQTQVYSASL